MSAPATPQRITVTIDGHAWTQVSDLSHSAPDETHFTVGAALAAGMLVLAWWCYLHYS